MFFFKKNKENKHFIKIAALLIHAAKIDGNYSNQEKNIIKKTLMKLGVSNTNIEDIFQNGENTEKNSVQILEFTKQVKNMNENNKIMIIEALWRIIYSDKNADMFEASLMRKLAGLLYIDNKIMGDIKDKIKKENS